MKRQLLQIAFTLLLASTASAFYQAEQGRWLNRDPIGESGGVNIYGFVANDSLSRVDLFGLAGNDPPASVEAACCGGLPYVPAHQCCENDTIVAKVELWVFKGKLGGDGESADDVGPGPISHSYFSANESGVPSYGKHPRSFTAPPGSPFKGPGFVNREDKRSDGKPGRDPSKATKEKRKVCPAELERMTKEGATEEPYNMVNFGGGNCHSFAGGCSN